MKHYYSENNVALNPIKKEFFVLKEKLEFFTGNGVFSKDKLDNGSGALIKYCDIKVGQEVLDLGCGMGIIGISVAKEKEINITFSDVNPNAIKLAKMNTKLHEINAKIINSDLFEKLGTYDVILTNPPYVAGRKLCTRLVQESINHLNKGGSLQLVARYQKGGKYFEQLMKETFGNVEVLGKQSGYRVFKSIK